MKIEKKGRSRRNRMKQGKLRGGLAVLFLGCLVMLQCVWPGAQLDAQAASPAYQIRVNRQENCVTIYKKDSKGQYTVPYKAMACSTGGRNTPLGTFQIPVKYRWRALVENTWGQYATRIDGPILFHSVPYRAMDPSAMMEGEFNKLGTAASHGCIRLTVEDARWIYENIPVGTTVIIYDADDPGPLGKPDTVKIGEKDTWDPTDIWSAGNPFLDTLPQIETGGTLTVRLSDNSYDLMEGVSAVSSVGEDITGRVTVSGIEELTADKTGVYRLVYRVEDGLGRTAERIRYVRIVE